MNNLFQPYQLGSNLLKNRIVMAPMTRNRAIGNIPNTLMAKYYRQRAGAGLIISEGVSPSPNGLGYARIPGIFSDAQVEGWKLVTDAVHQQGGKIFCQFMHCGRMAHPLNLPKGAEVIAPSAIAAPDKMYTDQSGLLEMPTPREMTSADLISTKKEFMKAAINAITAGFDGVELHGANGYLLEQFLSPHTNQRTDDYGGSIENRCRFVLEVVEAVSQAIGKEKTAIRLSPYGVNGGMVHYPEIEETYFYLASELGKTGVLYIHIADHSAMGAPEVPVSIKKGIRERFHGTLILAGGYTQDRATQDLSSCMADLIAFGRPFISNPDLPDRMLHDWPLNAGLDYNKLYTPGPSGYSDYPCHA